MLNKIIQFSIKNKFIVGLFTVVLIIYGGFSLSQLPIDAVPDITNNQVQVITVTPTLASQEVEQFVTAPIERAMATLPDLTEIRSISRFGLSVITIVFHDDIDVYFARQLVDQRIKEAEREIPPGVGAPELAPVSTGLGEIYQYVVRPEKGYENKYSNADLRTLQDWVVARRLVGTPGVAEINSFGGNLKQYEVAIDPVRLKSMNISIPEIFEALEKNNENTGGAYIDKKPYAYFIRALGLVSTLDDIGKIVVKTNPNGTPILIRDVATPQFGSAIRYGAMSRNGKGEVVGGVVMMLKGSNSDDVIRLVKEKFIAIQKSLPEGVTIEPYLDRSALVNKSIATVEKNLIEGALIVIFVLVLFLGNFRAGLIVASVIPLAMLFAVILMNLFHVSGNLMSLGALDFGLIVDGAVIIVEAILHRITQSHSHHKGIALLDRDQMNNEVYASASTVASSSTFGQFIILIVYIPILTLVGIEGKMFGPMAMTVSFAVIGALILSLTYIPMMASLVLSRKTTHKKNISDRLMDLFQRAYNPLINFAIKRKFGVIGIAVVFFMASLFVFSRMGGEFIPTLEEGDFTFSSILPQGSSLSQSLDNNKEVEKILLKFPEVKEVVSKTGSAEIPTDPMPPEATDVTVILKDQKEWQTAHSREALQDTMLHALQVIPGVYFEASQPIQMRFNELMTGVKQDIAVKIFGENIDTLVAYAERVEKVIGTVQGAAAPQVEKVTGLPQITIVYNRDRIAQYNLNVQDINRIVSTAFAGQSAGIVFENERKFDLVVRLDSGQRKDIEDIRNLFIPIPGGNQIPLQQVAAIEYVNGPAQISREDAKRRIVIGVNVRGRDVKSVVDELAAKLETQVKLPTGYYYTYGGQYENLVKATKRLMIAVPVALMLIFLLLYAAFNSVKQALLIYTAIPFSAIGGIFLLWVRGLNFSISAGVGFIALFGVAVLFGIVLVNFFNRLEKEGMTDVKERVIHGTRAILRPVLMASFLAAFGFLPMALATSQGAEVQRPLATVVIGGIFSATLLTLVVLPALYILFAGKKGNGSRRKNKKIPAATTIILFLFALPGFSNGQSSNAIPISLNNAISIAATNNLQVQANRLQIDRTKALVKTSYEIPKTGFFVENEDFNPSDKAGVLKIGVLQSLEWPSVYRARKNLAEANVKYAELTIGTIQIELLRDVRQAYYSLWYLQNKQILWQRLDSIYSSISKAAILRVRTGESAGLDSISAITKAREISVQLNQIAKDILIQQEQFKKLLKTDSLYLPEQKPFERFSINLLIDSIINHPSLLLTQQGIKIAEADIKVQQQNRKPDFSGRFFSQRLYGLKNPYSGFSVSVGIPIFGGRVYKNKIRAAEIQKEYQQRLYDYQLVSLSTSYRQGIQELQKDLELLKFYETSGLREADAIAKVAGVAYRAGEISFAEFSQFITQSIDIQKNYLEVLNEYNQSAIQLNYFINQ